MAKRKPTPSLKAPSSPAAVALRLAAAEAERLAADLRRRADLLDGAADAAKKVVLAAAPKKKRTAKKIKRRARAVKAKPAKKAVWKGNRRARGAAR